MAAGGPGPGGSRDPKAEPRVAVAEGGSRAFRVLNFELYAKPTRVMRALGYVGSTAALGMAVYMILAMDGDD